MANPTAQELRDAIALVTERIGYAKLYDRLVRLNAFVSRRKPPTPDALADRLYNLTSGLRRQVPATIAFHTVWAETVSEAVGEETTKTLEGLADRINAALTEDERAVREESVDELEAALDEYERLMTAAVGAHATRLDMLLKAVPAVAERLRGRPLPTPASAPAATPAPERER